MDPATNDTGNKSSLRSIGVQDVESSDDGGVSQTRRNNEGVERKSSMSGCFNEEYKKVEKMMDSKKGRHTASRTMKSSRVAESAVASIEAATIETPKASILDTREDDMQEVARPVRKIRGCAYPRAPPKRQRSGSAEEISDSVSEGSRKGTLKRVKTDKRQLTMENRNARLQSNSPVAPTTHRKARALPDDRLQTKFVRSAANTDRDEPANSSPAVDQDARRSQRPKSLNATQQNHISDDVKRRARPEEGPRSSYAEAERASGKHVPLTDSVQAMLETPILKFALESYFSRSSNRESKPRDALEIRLDRRPQGISLVIHQSTIVREIKEPDVASVLTCGSSKRMLIWGPQRPGQAVFYCQVTFVTKDDYNGFHAALVSKFNDFNISEVNE